jgi:hypothetical protein
MGCCVCIECYDDDICSTENCKNKKYIDNKCMFCSTVYLYVLDNKIVVIDGQKCPFCSSCFIEQNGCCYSHSIFFEIIRKYIKIEYKNQEDISSKNKNIICDIYIEDVDNNFK